MPDTLAGRLAAVAEMRADVEAKLADAEQLAVGTSKGAKLSRADAASYRRQLGLLADLEAWLRAAWPQIAPAEPDFVPVRRRGDGEATDVPVAADRPSAGTGAA